MMKIHLVVLSTIVFLKLCDSRSYSDYNYESDFLDMDPDSILEENARITTNATCGTTKREYYCRLVEHADGALLYRQHSRVKRQVMSYQQQQQSYRDSSGQWVQCNFCDDRDSHLRHPIDYVIRGEQHLWWQSPSLAEGLHYHAVTITMDFAQVYQIVYVLLRMGDSPRPANWILERSLDNVNYKPWVFFAESEYECRRLYQPLVGAPLTVTSGPRPWKLADDEVYCTTFYSKPEALQSGEIIITLSLDRESTSTSPHMMDRAISPKLIEFLSARYVRLRFQKLQTLSGDWMAMPNEPDSSVYNRYYYSIRTIKVGGKCLCNSHASRCEQKVINGVPSAICVCQHFTCGTNCETCCPMFNQQPWRPGRRCEECNCHGKADRCEFNQTVANLRLSVGRDGSREGGGVCIDCKQDTTGINCESCKPGFYRPMRVTPDAQFPCIKCDCNSYGSTGQCVSDDKEVPTKYPGDCLCKEGFTGKRCDQCAEGYKRSMSNPTQCEPCTCDVRGSHRGGSYRCEPPCNCKVNVNPDSYCRACQPGHFNLDVDNPEGCQTCYCSYLTDNCVGVSSTQAKTLERNGLLGIVSNLNDWKIINPSASAESGYPVAVPRITHITDEVPPLSADIRTVEAWLSSASIRPIVRGYYWSAPPVYLGKQITAYGQEFSIIVRFNSPMMINYFGRNNGRQWPTNSVVANEQLEAIWLNEPDVVLEGKGYRLAYILPPKQRDSHMIINIHMHESSFRVLVEPPASVPMDRIPIGLSQGANPYIQQGSYQQAGRPATISDLITVLSRVDRILIKTKYIIDQTSIELRQVSLKRSTMNAEGQIPNMEECSCPVGHTGTSCESCAFGYWRDPKGAVDEQSSNKGALGQFGMWRYSKGGLKPLRCVPCDCNGHSGHCDEQTGKCIDCQHNTDGDRCDKCAAGFYGDPLSQSPNACQPCECPTLQHQKTKSCIAKKQELSVESKPYVCLDCDENTRGRYCEVCAPGYYGDPTKGIICKKCECGPGAIGCNATTGDCICGFNTAPPDCKVCLEGTHGEPMRGQACRPCNCHEIGSLSITCQAADGQCTCNHGYEGKRCDRCTAGRGNVDAGCPLCSCNNIGTVPGTHSKCDAVTGQCHCKPGVGGTLDCSECDNGYFNLGPNGCEKCKCSNRAVDLICDKDTGVCNCGENVEGDACDKCTDGHFWNSTGPNCLPCECEVGTIPDSTDKCNMRNGQCSCAPHVTGRQCDKCEPGYFGISDAGCQECPSCPNGQKCDQDTGKCICPPNTEGDQCDTCSTGSWGYHPMAGCKLCNCSETGTEIGEDDTCDSVSGQCKCRPGFAGRDCTSCDIGFYGYPNCKQCQCDVRGTLRKNATTDTLCDQSTGKCYCKPNVQGEQCSECKPGTFGINMDYPLGCYSCFCFPTGSSPKCSALEDYRSVPDEEIAFSVISTDVGSAPGGALIELELGLNEEARKDLSTGVTQFNWRFSSHRPTFLEIPELKGSLSRRYGTVTLAIFSSCLPTGSCNLKPPDPTNPWEYMMADAAVGYAKKVNAAGISVIRDPYRVDAKMSSWNGSLMLEYQPPDDTNIISGDAFRSIWLRESDWVLTYVGGVDTRVRPTRNEFMLALMNVTSFSVRLFMPESKPKVVSVKYRVYVARSVTSTKSGTPITSIETCKCSENASGDHCELAADGFYFPVIVPKPGQSILPPKPGQPQLESPENIEWKGGVVKCNCHGMTSHCHPNTGVCQSCTGNTVGVDCGRCAEGYMGDPKKSHKCVKCQCPTDKTDYAFTCYASPHRPYETQRCDCKPGYTGQRCERCSRKYYGNPTTMIACQPCDCEEGGSKSVYCDQTTGKCDCWPGIFGRRCDECQKDHVVDRRKCRDCRGECTGELLLKADAIKTRLDELNVTNLAYRGLEQVDHRAKELEKRFGPERVKQEENVIERTHKLAEDVSTLNNGINRLNETKSKLEARYCEKKQKAIDMLEEGDKMKKVAEVSMNQVKDLTKKLPDAKILQRWQQDARRARNELNRINLNQTEEWLNETTATLKDIIGEAEELTKNLKPTRSLVDFERLMSYQEQQKQLLDGFAKLLHVISNATKNRQDELLSAKNESESLREAVENATNVDGLKEFQDNITALRSKLDDITRSYGDPKVHSKLHDAEVVLKNLTSVDSSALDKINIPSNLKTRYVVPLEIKSNRIVETLRLDSKLNQTIESMEAYNTIVTNIEKAENATDFAEKALKQSTSGVTWTDLLEEVKTNGKDINQTVVDRNLDVDQQKVELNNGIREKIDQTRMKVDQIQTTMNTASIDATNAINQAALVEKEVSNLRPKIDQIKTLSVERSDELNALQTRLKNVERDYYDLRGTAILSVQQANTTQKNAINLLDETESNVRKMDSKFLHLRSLADEARALLDVTYGVLSKDPIPISFQKKECVYSLMPYAISKSRVFDIEFWFRLHPKQTGENSVLMVGRRAYTGRTQMFAFTMESSNSVLRFSWNAENAKLELNDIESDTWYQVRVTSMWQKTKMMLIRRPDEEDTKPVIQETVLEIDPYSPEAGLIIDRQTELRFGGPLQTESPLTDPAGWGDNGAEAFWSDLSSMKGAQFCLFNLRVGGVHMSLVDLAKASAGCAVAKVTCQVSLQYRKLMRDGYPWEVQGPLNNLSNSARPSQSAVANHILQRMFYYDFAGTGGYARIKQLKDLKFCEDKIRFHVTPLEEVKEKPLMVFTFYNFGKDYGITVESIKGKLKATRWTGGQLYGTTPDKDSTDTSTTFRRRVLRHLPWARRWRRDMLSVANKDETRPIDIILDEIPVKVWRLDELLTDDCADESVLYVGGIPPGHYSLRRRMKELNLVTTPFAGRIGLTNEKHSQQGSLYLEEYVNAPAHQFGDAHFTDIRQAGEATSLTDVRPKSQYCLHFSSKLYDQYIELKNDVLKGLSPYEPGISMTVRFNPLITPTSEVGLLRIQMHQSVVWMIVEMTPDFRIRVTVPELRGELTTEVSLIDRPLLDPTYSLTELEYNEAKIYNNSLPAWKADRTGSSSSSNPSTIDFMEVVITLYFGSPETGSLQVLFDHRLVQSWEIPKQNNNKFPAQILLGRYEQSSAYPITINHLMVGSRLIDFSTDLESTKDIQAVHVGVCKGRLYPRFIERSGPIGTVWSMQGLDSNSPPGGRRARYVDFQYGLQANDYPIDSSRFPRQKQIVSNHATKTEDKLSEDCTENPEKSAWFDRSDNSHWLVQLNKPNGDKSFEVIIGFRARLTHSTSYSLLASFRSHKDQGNLNLLLSDSQLIVADANHVLWVSPRVTMIDENWHRLKMIIPKNRLESKITIELDGRHFTLPKSVTHGIPLAAQIGGMSSSSSQLVRHDVRNIKVEGIFGCVDELKVNGVDFDPTRSRRPPCYECFSLAPNVIHVPASIETYLQSSTIPLTIPKEYLSGSSQPITLEFSFLQNQTDSGISSLFILTFNERSGSKTHQIWLYLVKSELKMASKAYGEAVNDEYVPVLLPRSPPGRNAWHSVNIRILLSGGGLLLKLGSQKDSTTFQMTGIPAHSLESIVFGQDGVLTFETMQKQFRGSRGKAFAGCLKDISLRTDTDKSYLEFPPNVPGLVKGLCPTG